MTCNKVIFNPGFSVAVQDAKLKNKVIFMRLIEKYFLSLHRI